MNDWKILTQIRSNVQQEYTAQNFASFKNLNLDPSVITANVAQEVLVVCGCEAFANSCLSPIGKQYLLSPLGCPVWRSSNREHH